MSTQEVGKYRQFFDVDENIFLVLTTLRLKLELHGKIHIRMKHL